MLHWSVLIGYSRSNRVISEIQSLYRDESPLLSGSLKTTSDENLLREFARRGYDLSKRRDKPTTAEIIKIG